MYNVGKKELDKIFNNKDKITYIYSYNSHDLDEELECCLDVCLVDGRDPTVKHFYNEKFKDPMLDLVVKELQSSALIPASCMEDQLIVSFHNDDMLRDVKGIGERVTIDLHDAKIYYRDVCEIYDIEPKDFQFEYELTPYRTNIKILYLR